MQQLCGSTSSIFVPKMCGLLREHDWTRSYTTNLFTPLITFLAGEIFEFY